jgi:small subunit ribosomal protein S16
VLPTFARGLDREPMPVRLRLSLHGRRNNRIFHLVATDLRKRRDAKPIELLGVYDPRLGLDQEHKTMHWSVERILYWLEKGGAQPSKPVVKLLEKVCISFPLFCLYPEGL